MSYFIEKTVKMGFDQAVTAITATLKEQGFGIVSDIDFSGSIMKNLGKEIAPYRLLGACNPGYAYDAITAEPEIGVLLPCGIAVRQLNGNNVSVSAIDPDALMLAVKNDKLDQFVNEVKEKLTNAINNL